MSNNKNKTNKALNRRDLITLGAKGAITAGVGLNALGMLGSQLPNSGLLGSIKELASIGELNAVADTLTASAMPVIQIVLIDKLQQALLFPVTETLGTGDLPGLDGVNNGNNAMFDGAPINGQALPANAMTWRGIQMTALFANRLAGMNPNYNITFLPQFTSNAGGHSLQNTDMGMDKGGLNYILESKSKTGLMGAIGFEIQADANNSRDSFVAPGRVPMSTYKSVAQLRSTLKNSVGPLTSPQQFLAARQKLDALAAKNDKINQALLGIRDQVNSVMAPLLEAMTANDIVKQQVRSVIALAKGGSSLAGNFMIAIPWDDTNGGGNLANPGGQAGINPYSGVAMLAWAYNEISRELPNAITVTTSDGGRSRNNGDAALGMAIITGPSTHVANGVDGRLALLADLGDPGSTSAGKQYQMSDGSTTRLLEHRHILSLIAKIAHGIDTGVPYPKGVSPKAA